MAKLYFAKKENSDRFPEYLVWEHEDGSLRLGMGTYRDLRYPGTFSAAGKQYNPMCIKSESRLVFPMDLVGQFPVSGKVLKERGFAFFREDRQYQLDTPDQNGIVRVFSKCREEGPEEDGYGAMEYFDWWMMDTNLEPIPGVKVFYGYSPPNLFGTGMKEKWQEQYALAVEILKNRK